MQFTTLLDPLGQGGGAFDHAIPRPNTTQREARAGVATSLIGVQQPERLVSKSPRDEAKCDEALRNGAKRDRAVHEEALRAGAKHDGILRDEARPRAQRLEATRPCQENDAELWFAESASQVEQAKSLCMQCPFQASCLASALERSEPWGVWGGQIFHDGAIVATKRGRGRPRKEPVAA